MAQLVFSSAGARLGAALLPNGLPLIGPAISGAAIGGALGGLAGASLDALLAGPVSQGPRLESLHIMESREGAGMPRIFGRMRIGGQVIWASRLEERKTTRAIGGKGSPRATGYSYKISLAVGLCEGVVTGIDRVWANGELLDLSGLNWRLYTGSETQSPDPLIVASEGSAPAFRGLAYIVFEDFPLDDFGARLPQLSFEVSRPVDRPGTASLAGSVRAVNLIPGSGEAVLSPVPVRRVSFPGVETVENVHTGNRADGSASQPRSIAGRIAAGRGGLAGGVLVRR